MPVDVPAETINRVCGSGLQAVVHAVEALAGQMRHSVVAGGTESMSNAPYLLKGARWGYRMGERAGDRFDAERRADVRDQRLPHGDHRRRSGDAATTSRARIRTRLPPRASVAPPTRSPTVRSRRKSFRSRFRRRKGDPVRVDTDEYPRPGTTVEKLGALKPAFKKNGSVTAGNASGINDGAAALVVMQRETARERRHGAAGARRWRMPSPASIR